MLKHIEKTNKESPIDTKTRTYFGKLV